MATACKFVTLAGADYFLGVVALLNSLRKTGHEQELVALDRGLTREQRELLEPYATLVRLPEEVAARSLLAKPVFHQYVSADVVVWLDADIIVTGSLERVVDCAAAGTICIYPDDRPSRWFGAWHSAFGLRAPLRPQVYVNAGAFAIRSDRQAQLAPRWEELCAVDPGRAHLPRRRRPLLGSRPGCVERAADERAGRGRPHLPTRRRDGLPIGSAPRRDRRGHSRRPAGRPPRSTSPLRVPREAVAAVGAGRSSVRGTPI